MYLNLVLFDADGEMRLAVRELPGPVTLNARGADYFEGVLRGRKGVISRPMRSRLSGNDIMLFSAPVFDAAGRVSAVLTAASTCAAPASCARSAPSSRARPATCS
jgi:hypothetical protein